MAKEYTIPQILQIAGIRGYTPRLASAVNTLLNSKSNIEYEAALKTATIEITGYDSVSVYDDVLSGAYAASNHFEGLPIYMPLLFEKIEGTSEDLLLESAILEINRPKNIVVTTLQGRDTSVKEFINNGDFVLSVSGIICKKGVGYPMEQVKNLAKFFAAKVSIPIVHEVLNMLGVYELVITSSSLPSSPFTNAQPYSFNALSESPIELEEN